MIWAYLRIIPMTKNPTPWNRPMSSCPQGTENTTLWIPFRLLHVVQALFLRLMSKHVQLSLRCGGCRMVWYGLGLLQSLVLKWSVGSEWFWTRFNPFHPCRILQACLSSYILWHLQNFKVIQDLSKSCFHIVFAHSWPTLSAQQHRW